MKKMISRRNFLKAAALAGSAMALTACGGKGSAGDEAAAAIVVDGPVEFPLAETVTLTGTTSYPAGSESEPNNRTIFKRLEESTNVHIEWTAIQSDQWGDKISLNMSNPNTLTDFIFTADFSDSNLLRYAKQGVVIALEEYIDTCMPNLQAVFEKYPEYRTMCTDTEGHIWALPWIEQHHVHRHRGPHLGPALDRAAGRGQDRDPDHRQYAFHQHQVAQLPGP